MNVKKHILILFLGIFSFVGYAQEEIDSLLKVTRSERTPQAKAYAFQRLAWLHILNDVNAAEAYNDTAQIVYKQVGDERGLAQTHYKFGVIYRYKGDYRKALEAFDKYKIYVERQQDTFGFGNVAYQKGVVYSLQGDYENSLKEYERTLHWYELKQDTASFGFVWNSIGLVQKNLMQYEKALHSFEQAQYYNLKFNKMADIGGAYGNMATIYFLQGNYPKAENFQNKALKINQEINNNWGIAGSYFSLGNIAKLKGNKNQAISYYLKAKEIQVRNKYFKELAETKIGLALLYREANDIDKAKKELLEALPMAKESKNVRKEIHRELKEMYAITLDHKDALHHANLYALLKDSILNEENIKQINFLSEQYETKKKDQEIAVQQLQLIKQESELDKKNGLFRLALVGLFALVALLLGSWIIYTQRQKRKAQELIALRKQSEIETLESLIQGEEKERLRIAQELHDGVNGDLSAIKFKLNSLQENNAKEIAEAVAMLDKSCEQVRAISHNLVPPALENFDLRTATSDYCYKMNANYASEISFQYLGDSLELPKEIEINIYRIIQELVTNSLKHAQANEIHVQLSSNEKILQLTVEDNGMGFEAHKTSSPGMGLKNITSRVDYLGGELDIVSNKEGTSVSVLLTIK